MTARKPLRHTLGPWHSIGHSIYGANQAGGANRFAIPIHPHIAAVSERTGETEGNLALMRSALQMAEALEGIYEDLAHAEWANAKDGAVLLSEIIDKHCPILKAALKAAREGEEADPREERTSG